MICDKIISDENCNTIVQDELFDSKYAYIYILQLNKSDGNYINQIFNRENEDQDIIFTIRQDGYYTLCRLIVSKDSNEPYYYKDGKFYNGENEVSLQDLISINPEITKVNITYYYYFQLCKLRKCFAKIAQQIINDRTSIKCNSNKVNSQDIYRRDLLWSTLNVIMYLAESDQFEEAERLLERVTGCNGIGCEEINNSCGCR